MAARSPEELAQRALEGDREALGKLVGHLQYGIFGLTLRMLNHRGDAGDATQEIFVRIVTRLSRFDFRSRLTTWAYGIADAPYLFCQASFGKPNPALGLANRKTSKADLIAVLKEAFSRCDSAFAGLTDAQLAETV